MKYGQSQQKMDVENCIIGSANDFLSPILKLMN